MQSKDNLFSIGEFSKITGMGIHSLRYYDEIGALKPAYVDPRSNYRYYGFEQLSRVPGINMCLDAGIKLSEFSSFVENDSIDYKKIIHDSRAAIDKRIEEFNKQKEDLDRLEESLSIKDSISSEECKLVNFGSHLIWLMPVSDDHISEDECSFLVSISSHAARNGCQIQPSYFGLIQFRSESGQKNYAFSAVDNITDRIKAMPYLHTFPSGKYYVQGCSSCSLDDAEKLLAADPYSADQHVIISLIIPGNNKGGNLHYAAASCS